MSVPLDLVKEKLKEALLSKAWKAWNVYLRALVLSWFADCIIRELQNGADGT